ASDASVDALAACVAAAWREGFEAVEETQVDVEEVTKSVENVRKAMDELKDWEWIYGRTPVFDFVTSDVEMIKIKNGRVSEARDQSIIGERFTQELLARL
ncbi:hypothetical protein PENTCL1PPCAC_19188, partial [Pristionchus entomophagus]